MIGIVLPTENSQLFCGNFPSIQLWHLAPRTPDNRGCWKQSSMVTQGFCYSEQELSCHLIKLRKAASSFPRQPSSLPSTRIGGRNPVLITACEEWAKNMLPNISQAQESGELPGRENGGGQAEVGELLTVCYEGRLGLMGCPPAGPYSTCSPLTSVSLWEWVPQLCPTLCNPMDCTKRVLVTWITTVVWSLT